MEQELKDEYRQVRFRCGEPDPPPDFFIITAHNPDGITVNDSENRQADESLRAEVASLGYASFSVTGGSADFAHAEPGYGLPCSREEALALARQFRQDAVFYVLEGRVVLVSASRNSIPDEDIGNWDELLIQPEGINSAMKADESG